MLSVDIIIPSDLILLLSVHCYTTSTFTLMLKSIFGAAKLFVREWYFPLFSKPCLELVCIQCIPMEEGYTYLQP